MQEDIEQRTMSVTVQAAKLSGRVLKAAIAAALQKMEHSRNTPKVGRNSMKRLTYKDPGANTIEVSGRIRSFERYARKYGINYALKKDKSKDPPVYLVFFKGRDQDALNAAFREFSQKQIQKANKPSIHKRLAAYRAMMPKKTKDKVKNRHQEQSR